MSATLATKLSYFWLYYKELIIWLVITFAILIIFGLWIIYLFELGCNNRWKNSGFQAKTENLACFVNVKGKWVEERFIIVFPKISEE